MYYVIDLSTDKLVEKFDFKGEAESYIKGMAHLHPKAALMVIDDAQALALGVHNV